MSANSWTLIAIAALAVAATAIGAQAPAVGGLAQTTASVDPVALKAYVDSFMTARMASDRIPGAGFVFVQNGRVLLSRGYGLANVAGQRPVRPRPSAAFPSRCR